MQLFHDWKVLALHNQTKDIRYRCAHYQECLLQTDSCCSFFITSIVNFFAPHRFFCSFIILWLWTLCCYIFLIGCVALIFKCYLGCNWKVHRWWVTCRVDKGNQDQNEWKWNPKRPGTDIFIWFQHSSSSCVCVWVLKWLTWPEWSFFNYV